MSNIHLITIEAALLLSTMAFMAWVLGKAHGTAIQVYSGVADGVRLSRRSRRLVLITTWGGYISLAIATNGMVSLALLQIGTNATSPETARMAYLFALTVFLPVPYLVISGVMMALSLNNMIRRGLRGERA